MSAIRAGLFGVVSYLRRRVRFLLYRVHDAWAVRGVPEHTGNADVRRVLLLRTDLIGDFLLWVEAGRALAQHYRAQGWQVTLLVNRDCGALAVAFGIAEEVWSLDRARFVADLGYRSRMLRQLAQAGFSEVLQTAYSREAFIEDGVVSATRAARRVSWAGECYNIAAADRARSNACYTDQLASTSQPRMELLRNAELLREFGLRDFRAAVARLPLAVASRPPATPNRPYAVLFPGASGAEKRWPATCFAEIGRRLHAGQQLEIVIAGGPGDVALARGIAGLIGIPVIDLSGQTSLLALAELLRGARLLLSNDTAAAHLGAIVGVPVVCIAGGWQGRRFMPYQVEVPDERPLPIAVSVPMDCWGCLRKCIHPVPQDGPFHCIAEVSVEAVWSAIQAVPK